MDKRQSSSADMKPQHITVLGSTGSIGTNTLDVIARHPDRFQVFALSGATQVDLMLRQCAQFKPRFAVMVHADTAQQLKDKIQAEGLATEVLSGETALDDISAHPDVDAVMAAIVGAAGLPARAAAKQGDKPAAPTMAAITASTSGCAEMSSNAAAPLSTSVDKPSA